MKTFNIYGITLIVAISGFLLGVETSSLSIIHSIQFDRFYGSPTRIEETILSSSISIGAIVGCVLCGMFCDTLGCISTFQLLAMLWCLGSGVMFFSDYIYLVVIGRVLKGISLGIITSVTPVYIAEVLPRSRRGHSLSIVQFASVSGSIAMYYLGYIFEDRFEEEYSFKWTWAIETIPAFVLLPLSLILPESPKWLAANGKWAQAASSLARIQKYRNKSTGITRKSTSSVRVLLGDKGYVVGAYTAGPEIRSCSYSKLFGKQYWRHTLTGVATQAFVQASGVSTFMILFAYICDACGVDSSVRLLVVSGSYIAFLIFTLLPVFLLDKCRRKDMLTFGMFLMASNYAGIFVSMWVFGESDPTSHNFPWKIQGLPASAVLALCLSVVVVYCSVVLPVSWLYVCEIFHGPSRAKGNAVSMAASWSITAAITLVLPSSMKSFGPLPLLVLSGFCFAGALSFLVFPETKDRSEIEIEFLFNSKQRIQRNSDTKEDFLEKVQEVETNILLEKGIPGWGEDYSSGGGIIVGPEAARLRFQAHAYDNFLPTDINKFEKSLYEDIKSASSTELMHAAKAIEYSDLLGGRSQRNYNHRELDETKKYATGALAVSAPFNPSLVDTGNLDSKPTETWGRRQKSPAKKNIYKRHVSVNSSEADFMQIFTAREEDPSIEMVNSPSDKEEGSPNVERQREGPAIVFSPMSPLLSELPTTLASPESHLSNDWIESGNSDVMQHFVRESTHLYDTSRGGGLSLPESSSPEYPISSGDLFYHNNSEGSPSKAGVTYEPTTFLQSDSLRTRNRIGRNPFQNSNIKDLHQYSDPSRTVLFPNCDQTGTFDPRKPLENAVSRFPRGNERFMKPPGDTRKAENRSTMNR